MANFLVDADSEREMRDILSHLGLPEIINILRVQTDDMDPEQAQFYLDEIDLWGSIGDKQQLISDIINIAEEYVGLDEVMDVFEDLTQGLPPVEAQTRYMPKSGPEGFEWSEETSPTERLKWMDYNQYPGSYSREEKGLLMSHPEKDYADPDLLRREQEEGKTLGLGPILPETLPTMDELPPAEQLKLRKLMQQQIHAKLQSEGTVACPRPMMMEMVYDYLYITGNTAEMQRFLDDGVQSRSRYGFHTTAILKRMFDQMSLEDLYLYWNSIVNYRELPWVDEQSAILRFGGGAMGSGVEPMYHKWLATDDVEAEAPSIEWPEEVTWAERTPQWEQPA